MAGLPTPSRTHSVTRRSSSGVAPQGYPGDAAQRCWLCSGAAETARAVSPRRTRTPWIGCWRCWRPNRWPMRPGVAGRAGPGRPVGAPIAGPGPVAVIAVDGKAARPAVDRDGQAPTRWPRPPTTVGGVVAERLIRGQDQRGARVCCCCGLASRVGGVGGARVHKVAAAHRPLARHVITSVVVRALRDDREAEHAQALRQDRHPGLDERPDRPREPSTSAWSAATSAPSGSWTPPNTLDSRRGAAFLPQRYTIRTIRTTRKASAATRRPGCICGGRPRRDQSPGCEAGPEGLVGPCPRTVDHRKQDPLGALCHVP